MNEDNKKELMIIMPRLRRYCYALTNNKENGDDLLHDSIVKILSKFDYLKIDNFQAYIYRLISNTWKDNLRKKYTRNEVTITAKNIENDPQKEINVYPLKRLFNQTQKEILSYDLKTCSAYRNDKLKELKNIKFIFN